MGNKLSCTKRREIRKRDQYTCALCKLKDRDINGKSIELQVHHIVPYQYAMKFLKWPKERTNSCFNLITLCSLCHTGNPERPDDFCVHPDFLDLEVQIKLRAAIGGDNYEKALKYVEPERTKLAESGIKYWRDDYDLELSRIAERNTKTYINKNGWAACKSLFNCFEDAEKIRTTIRSYLTTEAQDPEPKRKGKRKFQ